MPAEEVGVMVRGREVSTLGSALRRVRLSKGLTQKQLAEQCEISQASISRVEDGRVRSMRSARLQSVADVLDVSVDHLLAGDGALETPGPRVMQRRLGELEMELCARDLTHPDEVEQLIRMMGHHVSIVCDVELRGAIMAVGGESFVDMRLYGRVDGSTFSGRQVVAASPAYDGLRDRWISRNPKVSSVEPNEAAAWFPGVNLAAADRLWVMDFPAYQSVLRFVVGTKKEAEEVRQLSMVLCQLADHATSTLQALGGAADGRDLLAERTDMFRVALDDAPVPVLITDAKGRILEANRLGLDFMSAAKLQDAECRLDEILVAKGGQQIADLLSGDSSFADYLATVRGGRKERLVVRACEEVLGSGKRVWVHCVMPATHTPRPEDRLAIKQGIGSIVNAAYALSGLLSEPGDDPQPTVAPEQLADTLGLAVAYSGLDDRERVTVDSLVANLARPAS